MIGFREGLTTQVAAYLLFQEEVLGNISQGEEHLILVLELRDALNCIPSTTILGELQWIICRERMFSYVQSLITDRMSKIGIGSIQSKLITMLKKGTPR